MNLSVWSIKNPIPTILFFIFLTFGGMASFLAMKVQYYPDINLPTIIVTTSMPGASPIQLENEVVRKIENSIASVQGLKHITSKIVDSSATITAEFRIEKLTQEALDEVRSAISSIRADLPSTLRDP